MRHDLLNKRSMVPIEERDNAARSAMQLLIKYPIFTSSHLIGCYFAQDKEFDCMPIIKAIWQAQKDCFLPVLSEEKSLKFVQYRPDDRLKFNRYRILEPENSCSIQANRLELVLLPLVGFDHLGNRLGMGGGYYDRTFGDVKKANSGPYLMGLAFEIQKVKSLPIDPWDVKMNGVVTEKKIYSF